MGHDPDHLLGLVSQLNLVLTLTKQKIARDESKIVALLISWLTLCLIGVVLIGCLTHWAYSFIFVAIMIIGVVVFTVKFKQT